MLQLNIGGEEFWDEEHEMFIHGKPSVLKLEHSLISIAKWEAKWNVPFLESEKTSEMSLDYIKCMTLNTVEDDVYLRLSLKNIEEINKYITAPMTATRIKEQPGTPRKVSEIVTAELIYYWMILYNIPKEFEKWHFSRLVMLIRVCSEKSKPAKKMSNREIMAQNKAINAARRAKLNSKG